VLNKVHKTHTYAENLCLSKNLQINCNGLFSKKNICWFTSFVLNLLVMLLLVRVWLIIHLIGWFTPNYQLDLVRIVTPKDGEVLQGNVAINGTVTGVGLQYADIGFQFQDTTSSEWFLIARVNQAVIDENLTNWETSTVADGDYRLRVMAQYSDGHQLEVVSQNLRVRNYTPIETIEATAGGPQATAMQNNLSANGSVDRTAVPTATSMPGNKLSLTYQDLSQSAIKGAISGVLLLTVLGLWLIIRRRRLG